VRPEVTHYVSLNCAKLCNYMYCSAFQKLRPEDAAHINANWEHKAVTSLEVVSGAAVRSPQCQQ
jgi:hypothetical protein